jgi:glycosyltransferase involved in cell wall biosynthesis
MANILVNGFKANAGGGKMILINFIKHLEDINLNHIYFILTPDGKDYINVKSEKIVFVNLPLWCKKNSLFIFFYFFKLPKLLKSLKIDLIFNFGDVIIPGRIRQIYFFDWAYAVYNESYIWSKMPLNEKIKRKIKVALIRAYIGKVSLVLTQTKNIERRLIVIPTPVGIKPERCEREFYKITKTYNLLYPASFSPHKNHRILIDVAKLIASRKLNIVIYLTIDNEEFINEIYKHNLSTILINMGTLNNHQMNCAYQDCDAIIMPTL